MSPNLSIFEGQTPREREYLCMIAGKRSSRICLHVEVMAIMKKSELMTSTEKDEELTMFNVYERSLLRCPRCSITNPSGYYKTNSPIEGALCFNLLKVTVRLDYQPYITPRDRSPTL
ncbi:uncharacterized protein RAG0_00637 [Rhynchosporium agropyri]|uniref:Uncharacterized protein n=1 Tax=Rhynchosporium agropyri TaxID=914238 RepID=A0A1E1JU76_9HELO|nr:uncharacterized protein RAG0_00637 [Rhynchosporium agropyri]